MTIGNSILMKKNSEENKDLGSFEVINSKADTEIEEIKQKLREENMGYYYA